MKFAFCACGALAWMTFGLGCDAMKPREPKQAQDPIAQTPKYGDTKLENLDPDAGAAPSK